MSEAQFEEFLQREAPAYNPPGDVPREEMWKAIAAARRTGGAAGSGDLTLRRRNPWRVAPWMGMAAMLLVGVSIGHWVTAGYDPADRPATLAATEPTSSPVMATASREHLARAEALITLVTAGPANAAMDSLTARWASDVLTNTRLLMDSPAGEDPVRRQLLEDLETVLVLLVQRSAVPADDRALVDRSLQRTQLLNRLRTSAVGI